MNELARHIEILLLENDCVIVPGFGGFVIHPQTSVYVEDENLFLPPTRSIGFNPQLKINDGLLVQSFMSVYGTSFPDATKMVDKAVEELRQTLHNNGQIDLPNIGELHYTIHGTYDFMPYSDKMTSPELYGLDSFCMKTLCRAKAVRSQKQMKPTVQVKKEKAKVIRMNPVYWMSTAAAVVAVLLSFFISTPIENTEVWQNSQAQLSPMEMMAQVKRHSLALNPVASRQTAEAPVATKQVMKQTMTTLPAAIQQPVAQPEASKTEAPSPTPQAVAKPAKPLNYHIIVASVESEKQAKDMAAQLKAQGFDGARALIGGGKMRVSLRSYATQREAYNALTQIRQEKGYENAWVLKFKSVR